jgi:hypothetical protein
MGDNKKDAYILSFPQQNLKQFSTLHHLVQLALSLNLGRLQEDKLEVHLVELVQDHPENH